MKNLCHMGRQNILQNSPILLIGFLHFRIFAQGLQLPDEVETGNQLGTMALHGDEEESEVQIENRLEGANAQQQQKGAFKD
jgi:hypothetical protein